MTHLVSTLVLRVEGGVTKCCLRTESASAPARPGFLGLPSIALASEPDETLAQRAAWQALRQAEEHDTGTVPGLPMGVALDDARSPGTPLFDAGRWCDPSGSTPDIWCFVATTENGQWETPEKLLDQWSKGKALIDPRTRQILATVTASPGPIASIAEQLRATGADFDPIINEWVPGIHVLPLRSPTLFPATHTNCALVGTVAIDPASPYVEEQDRLDAWLDRILAPNRTLSMVLLTHDHADHFADARRLADRWGVPVGAHAMTRDRLPQGTVDVLIEDRQTIPAGLDASGHPVTLQAIHTPGHARGHLCYLEESRGVLVAGDMVAGVGTILIDPSDGHMGHYLDSLERMRSLGARMLIPAHGEPIGLPASRLMAYRDHRLEREAKVAAALVAAPGPATPGELVPVAYADTPEFLHPLAERSLIAHLEKLVEEGRARLDGDRYEKTVP